MKPISSIRRGLSQIPGALGALPPNPGYEGSEDAVHSPQTQTIWTGESPDLDSASPNFHSDINYDDGGSGNLFGSENSEASFDPVFEIGAEIDESFPGLNGAEGKKISESVQLHGIDALAWYVSFHQPGVQWGVYIPISGLAYLMNRVFDKLPAPLETKAHLAFHAVLNHELFHFATDYTIAQAELAHQEAWYIPTKKATSQAHPGYCVWEEQLANAYMLSAFRSMKPALRVKGKQDALKAFVKQQPDGYRDALEVRPPHWNTLLENLALRFGENTTRSKDHPLLWEPGLGYNWPARFPIRPRIDWRYCPIHLINDSQRIGLPPEWLSYFSRLPEITETTGFQKKLKKLTPPIQRAWERTKEKLGIGITTGADFKKWTKGGDNLFSVRVNNNFRAHLQRETESDEWVAVSIGNHKEMGHG